jgi:hypothetical protein
MINHYRFVGGNLRGAKPPKAKNGAFISRRLIFRVGRENIIKYMISELLDKAIIICFVQ